MAEGKPTKFHEIREELSTVLTGRAPLLDTLLPPLLFVIASNWLDLLPALILSMLSSITFAVLRWREGRPLRYAMLGSLGTGLAAGAALLQGSLQGFLLPDLITNGVLAALAGISVVAGYPLVAWTSHLARGWPLEWYRHKQVAPAYREVTWAWLAFFLLRAGLGWLLYRGGETAWLILLNTLLGWPTTVVLLIASYLYGTWRLRALEGPSVEEFKQGKEPPWESQLRGF